MQVLINAASRQTFRCPDSLFVIPAVPSTVQLLLLITAALTKASVLLGLSTWLLWFQHLQDDPSPQRKSIIHQTLIKNRKEDDVQATAVGERYLCIVLSSTTNTAQIAGDL